MTSKFMDTFDEAGQYMVEFALGFVIFIMFIILVMDLGFMIYNHNLFYHGVASAARQAALGASNEEIKNEIHRVAISNYIPSILGRTAVDTIAITPEKEINRVRGTEVEVRLDSTFGIMLMGVYPLTFDAPIRSHAVVTEKNDRDRDGCKDSLEGSGTSCTSYETFSNTYLSNHDNDLDGSNAGDKYYLEAGSDNDADNDGTDWGSDTVAIGYFSSGAPGCSGEGYAIYRPHDGSAGNTCSFNGNTWETDWFNGEYHAPEIWDDDSEGSPKLFSRRLPNWHVVNASGIDQFTRTLRTEHDFDNDGWIDKYDDDYDDPTEH